MSQIEDLLNRVDSAKTQLDSLRPLAREQEERVMQKFRLWWTYHSNAIEGNTLTQGETEMFLMEGLTAKNKPLKDHLDLRGHSEAINYLLDFIRKKEVLTEVAIRELHSILLVEPYKVPAITPDGQPTEKLIAIGEYKTGPNNVVTPTGETHFYAMPAETPAKMQDLMTWYRAETAKRAMHPVEIAARFHHRFTDIHPFDDGNGRMSRLLMNLMLMQDGYPPAVIRLSERNPYLAALRRADAGENDDFISFIAEHVVSSLELYLRAAKGEEIHEPTDLEKEIALLKIGLKHVVNPEPLNVSVQKRLFKNSIDPLLSVVIRHMTSLTELFSENTLRVEGEFGNNPFNSQGMNEKLMSLAASQAQPLSELLSVESAGRVGEDKIWNAGNVIQNLRLIFELKGFKKSRFDAFDLSVTLELIFEPLKYQLQLPDVIPQKTIEFGSVIPLEMIRHLYQEPLTNQEITEVAQKITRSLVDAIRQKTDTRC